MENNKNLNELLKQVDTQNDYNEVEVLENYYYSSCINEY